MTLRGLRDKIRKLESIPLDPHAICKAQETFHSTGEIPQSRRLAEYTLRMAAYLLQMSRANSYFHDDLELYEEQLAILRTTMSADADERSSARAKLRARIRSGTWRWR